LTNERVYDPADGVPPPAENGHKGPSAGRRTIDRETTRYLSATSLVSVDFARQVAGKIMGEPLRALAPAYGVDVVVVTRWAIASLQLRIQRDRVLLAILVLGIGLSFLAGLPAILVIMVIAAWAVVAWEYWVRIHRILIGKLLMERFDPADAPEPRDTCARRRLETVALRRDGNLIVFSGRKAFVGSGRLLTRKTFLLDASRGKTGDQGQELKPRFFTSRDVHEKFIQAIRDMGLDNVVAEERLFVNGQHIQAMRGDLLPDPRQPPPTSVGVNLVREAALHPTPDARAYVCAELPGWKGQLVVTLFARAVHTGGQLFIEWSFHVLPPLQDVFCGIDRLSAKSWLAQLIEASGRGLRDVLPALLRSPGRFVRPWWAGMTASSRSAAQLRAIEGGRIFDYGARSSIREQAAGRGRQHYFLARDEAMYYLLTEQALMRAVAEFLDEHDIGAKGFTDQVTKIIQQNFEQGIIVTGDIIGEGIAVGNSAQASTASSPAKSRTNPEGSS
jgi:hypothetical protein